MTAIDWLVKELDSLNPTQIEWHDAIEQAKEMFKQQIIEARDNGYDNAYEVSVGYDSDIVESETYYKEIYANE